MLEFQCKGYAHTCNGGTRRDFLKVGALGSLGMSLPRYLWAKEQGAVRDGHDEKSVHHDLQSGRSESTRHV